MIAATATQHMRHSKPAAGADNADYALFWQRYIRTAEMTEIFLSDANNRMPHRTEIIDQSKTVDSELFPDHGRPNNPGVVCKLENFARYRAGNGHSCRAR